ncbi:putative peroxisomal adenine nucleotide transporter 1 [Aulographum hederae CBS 113979]|uniref:Putative peroxisomal adenine nucleotide transporter 1 n=1 Tax=Aulographum hederae CBS 113979 TaxID=1176131 RepID=A0A6G1GXJ0_9PEZI|nr:putative peroxisomal adenine nucleotide transporter 1 [Aulographum hederae CBS 113979]
MAYNYLEDFEIYHQEQEAQRSLLGGPALPALGHAVSGAAGSAISNLLTYPLGLVITRLQVQKHLASSSNTSSEKAGSDSKDADYKSIKDAIQRIYAEEGGLKAFYSGIGQDTAKSVADSFFFFLAYNFLRQSRLKTHGTGKSKKRLSVVDELGVGMLAGAFSKLLTTPIQNIVTRKQTAAMVASRSGNATSSPELTTKDIALQIREEKGLAGFWSGYSATLILTMNPALTFLLQETLTRILIPKEKRAKPEARMTFIIAALSKSIASSITYPFSLAKTRAQVSSKKPTDTEPTDAIYERYQTGKKLQQSMVIGTVLRIAQTEGIGALYSGIEGEVVKGFFQHGVTMLMKERIHRIVVSMYYLVLKGLQKYPGPQEMGAQAKDAVETGLEKGKEVGESAKGTVGEGLEKAKEVGENAKSTVSESLEKAKEAVDDVIETAKKAVSGKAGGEVM